MTSRHQNDYTIGWVCALPEEFRSAKDMLDERHIDVTKQKGDPNTYAFGSINGLKGTHNVVIVCLSKGGMGISSAAVATCYMKFNFRSVQECLLVGIGGGVPGKAGEGADIRLGDIVVSCRTSKPNGMGVIQFDFGKQLSGGIFQLAGRLSPPSTKLLGAAAYLESEKIPPHKKIEDHLTLFYRQETETDMKFRHPGVNRDQLFRSNYVHVGNTATCARCDSQQTVARDTRKDKHPAIHFGLIASGNQVMKDGLKRDQWRDKIGDVLCFEMEAAGVMDLISCLVVRGVCDYADSHKNKDWQQYAALVAAAYAKSILNVLPEQERKVGGTEDDDRHIRQCKQDILNAIAFRNMNISYQEIGDSHDNTCEWIHKHEGFQRWKDCGSGLFWITGKPASGKSTLMKFLYDDLKSRQTSTDPRSGSVGLIVGGFFFHESEHSAGNPLLRSRQGFMRTILYQILYENWALIEIAFPDLFSHTSISSFKIPREWTLKVLKKALDNILTQQKIPLRVFLFVDGLDEFSEKHADQQDLAKMLVEMSKITTSKVLLQMCVASRPESEFQVTFKNYDQLRIHELTESDMRLFVYSKLGNHDFFNSVEGQRGSRYRSEDRKTVLLDRIVERSQGVFLWTKLVVQSIRAGLNGYERWDEIYARLDNCPEKLEALYHHILEKRDHQPNHKAAVVFQLLLTTTKPLSPILLSFILDELRGSGITKSISKMPQMEVAALDETTRTQIQIFCRGLVEWRSEKYEIEDEKKKNCSSHGATVYYETAPQHLVFLHLTVRKYLETKGRTWIDDNLPQGFSVKHPLYIAQACFRQLKSIPTQLRIGDSSFRYGCWSYALQKGPIAILFDQYDKDPTKFSPCMDNLNDMMEKQYPCDPKSHWTDLTISDTFLLQYNNFISYMAFSGKYEYVKWKIQNEDHNLGTKKGKPFLLYLLQISDVEPCTDPELVELALQHGCDANYPIDRTDIIGYSCEDLVLQSPNPTVWEVFLCEVCYFHFSPRELSRKNWLKILQAIKVLLNGGANPDIFIPIAQLDVKDRHRKYKFEMSVLSVVCQIASGPSWHVNIKDADRVKLVGVKDEVEELVGVKDEVKELVGVKDEVKELLKRKGQEENYILNSKTRGDLAVEAEEFLKWRTCLLRLKTPTSDTERARLLEDELCLWEDGRWPRRDEGAMSDTEMGGTNISDSDEEMNSADTSDGDEEMYEDDLEVSGVDRKRKRFSDEDQETTEGASRLPRHFRT